MNQYAALVLRYSQEKTKVPTRRKPCPSAYLPTDLRLYQSLHGVSLQIYFPT